MGVTIHYSGKLNSPQITGKVICELTDISNEIEWTYLIVDDSALKINGIVMNPPPNSDPLAFLFDEAGTLKNLILLTGIDTTGLDSDFAYVKTQFAPIEVHITIIKLLRYLKDKYLNNLEVFDEGCFWETGEKDLLKQKIDFINDRINELTEILSTTPKDENDSTESIIEKIENAIKKLKNRNQ